MGQGYTSGERYNCDNCSEEYDGLDLEYWRTRHDEKGNFIKNDYFCMICKKKLWGYT